MQTLVNVCWHGAKTERCAQKQSNLIRHTDADQSHLTLWKLSKYKQISSFTKMPVGFTYRKTGQTKCQSWKKANKANLEGGWKEKRKQKKEVDMSYGALY